MMIKSSYDMGTLAFLSVAAIFLLFIAIARIRNRKNTETNEFDERQRLIPGEAVKYGYFTLIVYFLFYGAVEGLTGKQWGEAGISLGICTSLAIVLIICIWNDAYVPHYISIKLWAVFIMVFLIRNLYRGIPVLMHIGDTDFYDIGYLFEAVLDILVLAVILLKALKDRREKDVEPL